MKEFLLYGHGGAYNHGAEAIVKCTVGLLNRLYSDSKIILSTHFKDQDVEFNMPVDEYCERDLFYLEADKNSSQKGVYDGLIYKSALDKITKDSICLSVGGDNYCYENWRKWKVFHETALKRGALSILWSCSIEPSMINEEMVSTLQSHHIITARESLTYNALKAKGLDNVMPCADIAFLLDAKECTLPDNFIIGNTVAINISPLVIRRENNGGIILRNTVNLIKAIIGNTDMNVVLVPHVLMDTDNDLTLLRNIYDLIDNKERVCFINKQLSAAEYKYIISKCRFGVFTRTHASIAAYSSCIPSIVIGYSVKSKGIATDLGLEDYVLPLKSVNDDYCLLSMFENVVCNEHKIKVILSDKMSSYKEKAEFAPL
ncbi:polysaccharide pyruvyl transferase family protein [Desulfosporosinus sp. SYSU MS00001]|uniref:polysaccharide pyruvyl transferase family protein n=1 Tax=Desulfosporosinus sp. SYSU MS00001 TaxID=3416284 RepID=UPI003CF2487F